MFIACGESKQSGNVETAVPAASESDDKSSDEDSKEADTSETLDADGFAKLKAKAIESCKSNLKIYADENLNTGFDGTTVFETPILGYISCELVDEFYSAEFSEEQSEDIFSALEEITKISEGSIQLSFATEGVFQLKADSETYDGGFYRAVVIPVAAGTSSFTLTRGEISSQGNITAKQYQATDVTAGSEIYNGTTVIEGVTACASCHQAEGGVDHSANLVGTCSDAELASAITTSIYGNNDEGEEGFCTGFEIFTPHNWTLDATQAGQVVAYLRSLPIEREEPDLSKLPE